MMGAVSSALMDLLVMAVMCTLFTYMLPSGGIRKSAQKGINAVLLLCVAETVKALLTGA